jgi:iron complex outermembrane recepter protein
VSRVVDNAEGYRLVSQMPPHLKQCRVVAWTILWSCLLTVLTATVSHAQAARNLTEDIPQQPLAETLAAYARQTGLQVVYVSQIVRGKSSKAAPAGLSPRVALGRLLEGTGLQFALLNERSVRIYPIESRQLVTRPSGESP